MSSIKTLMIWSCQRSRSTVLERPFLTRDDVEVVHEPMTEARFYGPERTGCAYSAERIASEYTQYADVTFEMCWNRIATVPAGRRLVVAKEHAKSVFLPQVASEYSPTLPDFAKDGNPTVIPTARLLAPEIAHIFLIRTPKEYIPSLHGLLVSSKTGIGQFDPEEVRMHESKRLYDFIALRGVGGRTPVVIDSEDLIGHPEAVLRHLCEIGGMEYRPAMLAWNAGDARVSELYCLSRAWHEGALNSTGILPKNDASAYADAAALPEVQEAIEANEPIYAYLKARAVRFA